jgi:hypothetical protein
MYAYLWARTAQLALPNTAGVEADFYRGKVNTARFYMQHCLPQVDALAKSIVAGPSAVMALAAEQFG